MSQAAQAPQRRPRREADSWATAEELEILGGIGRPKEADWTVLTVERDDPSAAASFDALDPLGDEVSVERLPAERAAAREPRLAAEAGSAREPAPRASEPEPSFDPAPAFDAEPSGEAAPSFDREPRDREPRDRERERDPETGRRTVVIRGQVASPRPIVAGSERRRPAPRTRDRVGHRPDRIAMWAVALGLLLILVAATTASAAPLI